MQKVYTADQIFTGDEWLTGYAVVEEDGIISKVCPLGDLPSNTSVTKFGGVNLAPSLIDIQIYGAGNLLLAEHPTVECLQKTYEYCKAGGALLFQPTVATNSYEVFYRCIDAVRDYWQQNGKGVIGLHIEGPWINVIKRGAHIESFIHQPTIQQVKDLLEYGKGVITIITLAPEICTKEIIDLIHSYNVVVSAGHTNATFDEASKAFDNGITAATHLFNAMSPLQHRAMGMVGAIMHHDKVMCSIVADGHHVNFAAVSLAKKLMGNRLFYITDAVTETNTGPYRHTLDGDKYVSNGILSGSALTMAACVKNGFEKAGIAKDESLRMASLYPAKVMKLDKQYGRIQQGYRCSLVAFDNNLTVVDTIG